MSKSWEPHHASFHRLHAPAAARERLLAWYRAGHRDLPWRDRSLPERAFAVLVAEVMSQQTRAEVAARKWREWMVRWPTAAALAAAPDDEVRSGWFSFLFCDMFL